jgi:hypothetical protein
MENGQKVRIGGIKFSEELVQVTVACTASDNSSIYQLLHLFAEKSINVPFLCHSVVGKIPESSFCVDRSELGRVLQIVNFSSFQKEHVSIISSVGTLTVFPHRNSCGLLGLLMYFFARHDFPVHSLSTSISAIALNTDYSLLDSIADKLRNVLELPLNHAPFRQGFRLTQIQP